MSSLSAPTQKASVATRKPSAGRPVRSASSTTRKAKAPKPKLCCEHHPDVALVLSAHKTRGRRIYSCPVPKCNFHTLKEKRTPKRAYDLELTAVPFDEHEEQVRLFQEVERYVNEYPELKLLFAVPNGGYRPLIVAARLKDEGVKAGVPDIFFPVARGGFHGWWGEMKREKGGRVGEKQSDWHADLIAQGYSVGVYHGWQAAWASLLAYVQNQSQSETRR